MSFKIASLLSLVCLLSQILFSIYYSSKIVDQNQLINNLQLKFNQGTKIKESLEIALSRTLSISSITKSNSSFQYIEKEINLYPNNELK